ncbi:CBS domain-containing protein [Pseudonocardia hierapolitana]|uniref:CBS domain-containing protein n=1 Tax=Pseudonocardia hierapolitana TaxID=1128676 RepID=A0A561SIT4_9PSEU|nr:CBS domain-containing protein [Pseudonocardia hierapolitana]
MIRVDSRAGRPPSVARESPGAGPETGLGTPLSDVVGREPLFVPPTSTVADVALAMREGHHSCAVVTSRPDGIVTNGDLARIVAERRPPDTPVEQVMSSPVHALPSGAPLIRALLLMLDEGVEHVPVTRGGLIVGVITDVDLIRQQSASPLLVADRIRRAGAGGPRDPALADLSSDLAGVAAALLADGVDGLRIAAIVASLHDSLTIRMLELAQQDLGPPPGPYAWLALGSQGRMEQLLQSDQDTALAFAEHTDDAGEYFAALAERVTDGLAAAGVPRCPGGFMATNWCRRLDEWQRTFHGWLDEPDARSLLDAQVFLDLRPVAGELDIGVLDRVLARGRNRPGIQLAFAQTARRFAPRVRRFGRLRVDRLPPAELKLRGTVPIVLLGRLYGLAAGSPERTTAGRLRAAATTNLISADTADTLIDAYAALLSVRLAAELGEDVPLALSAPRRRELMGALRAVRSALQASALTHPGTG